MENRSILNRLVLLCLLPFAAADVASGQRQLAPGVLTTIPATPEEAETVTGPRALYALAEAAEKWTPNYSPPNETLSELARQMTFRRPVWQLEFSFKPMRLLVMDGADGQPQRIWYLLYRIKNTGGYLKSVPQQDEYGNNLYVTVKGSRTLRFFPTFVIQSHDHDLTYIDRIVPGAKERIHAIEIKDPRVPLYDSVSITEIPIKASSDEIDRSVWGVAMWSGVDRRTDFFSVYVQGLSNAYGWQDGDQERPLLTFKTLQLNFWRPGDAIFENEKEFRYGLPSFTDANDEARILTVYGLEKPLDFGWVYRP